MKRFLLRLSIPLLTFFVSWAVTSVFIFFTHLPEVKVVSDDFDSPSTEVYKSSNSEIQIKYVGTSIRGWSFTEDNKINGIFEVTNNSNESFYYLGYDKNFNFNDWISQNDIIERAPTGYCAFGLKLQQLKPDETVRFEIPIPNDGRPYDAGFDFKRTKESDYETFWIKVKKHTKSNL